MKTAKYEKETTYGGGYEGLAMAIIAQAIKDYREWQLYENGIKKLKVGMIHEQERKNVIKKYGRESKGFLLKNANSYLDIDGKEIIKHIDKEIMILKRRVK